jgi:tripartite-type tricarboxylate transporter receptor subunit TctC
MKKLLSTFTVVCVLMVLVFAPSVIAAPKYANVKLPSTIRVIVAYNAGGSSDALARMTLPYWEKAILDLTGKKVNAVVVNLPGAGGEIGWTSLAYTQKDGSTIGVINLPAVPLVEAARKAGFSPWLEKFAPLGVNVIDPNVIRLAKSSKYGSLMEALAAAKAKPGSVTVGADGPLSDDHLAMYAVAQKAGAEFSFIPYAGGAPANRALQSGEVDIAIGNVFDHIQTKDSQKDAAIMWSSRYELIPDVPTIKEALGIDVGELGSTRGFAVVSGAPKDLIEVYQEAFRISFKDADYLENAKKRNITVVEPQIGERFGKTMKEQQALVGDLIQYFVKGGYIKNK